MKILVFGHSTTTLIGALLTSLAVLSLVKAQNSKSHLRIQIEGNDNIVVGDRVTLSCNLLPHLQGNTTVIKTFFYYYGELMEDNRNLGIAIVDKWLTFTRINSSNTGKYYCYGYTIDNDVLHSPWFILHIGHAYIDTTTSVFWVPEKITEPPRFEEPLNVELELMENEFKPDTIPELSTVHLHCKITPNTTNILKRSWFYDGQELQTDFTTGVWIVNSILELYRIGPEHAGAYLCQITTENNKTLCSNLLRINVVHREPTKEVRHWLRTVYKIEKAYTALAKKKNESAFPVVYAQIGDEMNEEDIRESDDVYFTCEVKPNTVQDRGFRFRHNGTRLFANDTLGIIYDESSLILKNISKAAAGHYFCSMTIGESTLNSKSLLLQVKDKWSDTTANGVGSLCSKKTVTPFVSIQLQGENDPTSIVEFEDVYFTCTLFPRGVARVHKIIWTHNNKQLFKDGEVGIIKGNSTLIIPRIRKQDGGAYGCKMATNKGHFESSRLLIRVYDNSTRVLPTGTIEFGDGYTSDNIEEFDNVYVKSNIKPDLKNVLRIRWYHIPRVPWLKHRQLDPFVDDVDILNFASILVFPNISTSAEGVYYCRMMTKFNAKLSCGSIIINVKKAPINAPSTKPPLILAELAEYAPTIYANNEVFFICHVYPATLNVTEIRWYYNGTYIIPQWGSQFRYVTMKSPPMLQIKSVQSNDIGNYTCDITTTANVSFPSAVTAQLLDVTKKPHFPTSPEHTAEIKLTVELQNDNPDDIHELENVFFYCDIQPDTAGFGDLSLKWFHNGTEQNTDLRLWNQTILSYGIDKSERTLISSGVGKEAAGNYTCQIQNSKGFVFTSDPFTLENIKDKRPNYEYSPQSGWPKIYAQLGDVSQKDNIYENYDTYLTCKIEPDTTTILDLVWLVYGTPVRPNITSSGGVMYIGHDLYFYNIKKRNSGDYYCRAITKRGRIESEVIELRVKPVPVIT